MATNECEHEPMPASSGIDLMCIGDPDLMLTGQPVMPMLPMGQPVMLPGMSRHGMGMIQSQGLIMNGAMSQSMAMQANMTPMSSNMTPMSPLTSMSPMGTNQSNTSFNYPSSPVTTMGNFMTPGTGQSAVTTTASSQPPVYDDSNSQGQLPVQNSTGQDLPPVQQESQDSSSQDPYKAVAEYEDAIAQWNNIAVIIQISSNFAC